MPQLTIPEDTYERLARRAAALNVTVEQLAVPALERAAAAQVVTDRSSTPPAGLPDDEWKARFHEILALAHSRAGRYPSGFQADISRESIYEGCGE
jgi:hypothetical protein